RGALELRALPAARAAGARRPDDQKLRGGAIRMRILASIILLSLLGACAVATKINSGDVAVGDRLQLKVDGAWNQVTAPALDPAQAWTMEGLPIDQLLIWSGVKDGEAIHPSGASGKTFNFRAGMQPDE